jgi:xylan 1,4-beta-xylosidase
MAFLRSYYQMIRASLGVIILALSFAIAGAQQRAVYENPVIPGDFPDPSIIRVGRDYWATATSGDWAPEFPLLYSDDLVNWDAVGAIFQRHPGWAAQNFWAPEISAYRGRFFVYYTARRKGGPLCIAMASAKSARGPYTDHGPLVCQELGSIDAMAVEDEHGHRYLVWKEDGNSRNQPTILWTQRLSVDGTRLVGSRKELIRNDPLSWEGGVVEGPFILRRDNWFYLFYSGNACCGRECNYAMGVARSRRLLGPWQRNPNNPILAANETWKCPGHGSIVSDPQGRNFLLYHAFTRGEGAFNIGREAMLDEVTWVEDGWPAINHGKGPSKQAPSPFGDKQRLTVNSVFDDFVSLMLKPVWEWPQVSEPEIGLEQGDGGSLVLTSTGDRVDDTIGAVVAQRATTADYIATTLVSTAGMKEGTLAGLSAYSGRDDALGIAGGPGRIIVYLRERKQQRVVKAFNTTITPQLYLRMRVKGGSHYRFSFSGDGREWKDAGEEIDGSFLEGARISLTAGGVKGASARFEWFRITPSSVPN